MSVYGIGNPLIDYLCFVEDRDVSELGLFKGTMNLVDAEKRSEILSYIKNRDIKYSCGGSCPNTMVTLKALGVDTVLAGGIGRDEHGAMYRKRLVEMGVGDELCEYDSPTGTSIILVTPDRERTMCTYLGANRDFDADKVDLASPRKADIFHFTGYMWDTEPQKRAIRKVLDEKKDGGFLVSFDIADPFAVGRYRQTFFEIIRDYADIVFANSEEARYLFDNYSPYECVKNMGKLCTTAVVKNGKKGSFVSHEGKIHEIPLYGTTSPVDTTGAGDTYAAGYLYGISKGYGPAESGCIASYLAGEIIGQLGAQFSEEKAEEIRAKLESGDLFR